MNEETYKMTHAWNIDCVSFEMAYDSKIIESET